MALRPTTLEPRPPKQKLDTSKGRPLINLSSGIYYAKGGILFRVDLEMPHFDPGRPGSFFLM